MNLTSIHLADLIEVLHGVLALHPVELRGESRRVVKFDGKLFALCDVPLTVEGPFDTMAELVTSLGVKKENEPWMWDGLRFEVAGDEATRI